MTMKQDFLKEKREIEEGKGRRVDHRKQRKSLRQELNYLDSVNFSCFDEEDFDFCL